MSALPIDVLPAAPDLGDAQFRPVVGQPLHPGHPTVVTHARRTGVDPSADSTKDEPSPRVATSGPQHLHLGQQSRDTQKVPAGVDPSQPDSIAVSTPNAPTVLADTSADPTTGTPTPMSAPSGPQPLADDHLGRDTQPTSVVGEPSQPDPIDCATPNPHPSLADPSSDQPNHDATPITAAAGQTSYGILAVYADILDDLESSRIANENRVRSLVQMGAASKETDRLAVVVEQLAAIEHGAQLELCRALRKHPLGPWVKRTTGIGEKTGARLLAAIGDPAERRTVSQLWAYCGYHVLHPGQRVLDAHATSAGVDPSPDRTKRQEIPRNDPSGQDPSSDTGQVHADTQASNAGVAPTRKRGQKANWNPDAKMRAYLCAEAALKAGVRKGTADDTDGYDYANREAITPYGQVYLDGRAKYADSVHGTECKRCGPAGKPAAAGSDLSDSHKHARAMRLVSKEILKDLWIEAKGLA